MKTFLVAAGLMVATIAATPASAAPVGSGSPAMAAPAPQHEMRRDHRNDRRWHARRGHHWGWNRHCRSVRRHHRWVRICRR